MRIGRDFTGCGKTGKSAVLVLKGRGFQPRRHYFYATYGTAGSRALSKLKRRTVFPQPLQSCRQF
jgi:hypothetical protein